MTLTNLHGLPEPLARAVQWSDRNREGCDYTVTELISPPRIRALERLHQDEISEDVSDRIFMLLGGCVHEIIRRAAPKERVVEQRAIAEVDGFKVGGQIDYAEVEGHWTMTDWKITSIYATKEGPKDEWTQQLNCYRYLAHQYGVEINKLQIVAIYRDWSKRQVDRRDDYPQAQVEVFPVELWEHERTQYFISNRIRVHEAAKDTLPLCTSEEMWERPEKWAVMRKGRKRAIKLCDSEQEANKGLMWANGEYVENRPAERPRCQDYCRVAQFCSLWQDFKRANQKDQNP